MSSFISHFISVLRKRGLLFFIIYFKESIMFDILFRTNTNARVPKERQIIDANEAGVADGLLYVASFTSVVKETIAIAANTVGLANFAKFQFVDLGCGKGKTLIFYCKNYKSDYPAVGIEYDGHLVELAQENIDRASISRDRAIVVNDSATNLKKYIDSDKIIVYIYNSFQGETFDLVVSELSQIPHILIYIDPAERQKLDLNKYTILCERKGRYNADTWVIAQRNV